jgi:ABC-type multidrug transport system ATPase subunit
VSSFLISSNLDPFGVRTDPQIWASLRSVHLFAKIQEMSGKLETRIVDNGKAFSIAERQLFCIARAILLDTSVLIFDEPPVAVDVETDHLIMQTIRENFSGKTVLILASRYHLIMQCDRLLVLSKGEVVEFDTPLGLLGNPRGRLSKMVAREGLDMGRLVGLAKRKDGKEKGGKEKVGGVAMVKGGSSRSSRAGKMALEAMFHNASSEDVNASSTSDLIPKD